MTSLTCPKGHDMTDPDNIGELVLGDSARGEIRRYCLPCRSDAHERATEVAAEARNAGDLGLYATADPYDAMFKELPRPSFHDRARCRGRGRTPEFADLMCPVNDAKVQVVNEGRQVCLGCPVALECLEYGITIGDHYGIRGATTGPERRRWGRTWCNRKDDDGDWMRDAAGKKLRFPQQPMTPQEMLEKGMATAEASLAEA